MSLIAASVLWTLSAAAGSIQEPQEVSWRLREAEFSCRIRLGDSMQYACGDTPWMDLEASSRRFERALKGLRRRSLKQPSDVDPGAPLLVLRSGDTSVSVQRSESDVVELVAAAQELIDGEEPLEMPEVAGCSVAVRMAMRAIRAFAEDRQSARDLVVCESGAWYRFENGHPVSKGKLAPGTVEELVALAEPALVRPPSPSSLVRVLPPVYCPAVVRRQSWSYIVGGRPVERTRCGMIVPRASAFLSDLRREVRSSVEAVSPG